MLLVADDRASAMAAHARARCIGVAFSSDFALP
jgi:hypothetical protein